MISDIDNTGMRSYKGKQVYRWVKHGKLPYIEYNPSHASVSLNADQIDTRSISLTYKTNIPVDEVMYSIDGENYYLFENKIDNLVPNTLYKVTLKVRRQYTNNYTISETIEIRTLPEPVFNYKIGDNVYIKGPVYKDAYISSTDNTVNYYFSSIEDINKEALNPYYIKSLGWVREESIHINKLYKFKDFIYIIIMIISIVIFIFKKIKSIL